jgi:hypothetical protein
MSEEINNEEILNVNLDFFNDVKWELIAYNKIDQESFIKMRAKNNKLYATFLGAQEQLAFYMFRPLSWETYKEIRNSELDKLETHELILKNCLVWPILNEKNIPEAGTILTLVYQILAQSSFLKDPNQALKMIVEV